MCIQVHQSEADVAMIHHNELALGGLDFSFRSIADSSICFGLRFLKLDCRLCVWHQVDPAIYLAPNTEPAGSKSNSLLCANEMEDNVGRKNTDRVTAVWGNAPLASKITTGITLFACMMEGVE